MQQQYQNRFWCRSTRPLQYTDLVIVFITTQYTHCAKAIPKQLWMHNFSTAGYRWLAMHMIILLSDFVGFGCRHDTSTDWLVMARVTPVPLACECSLCRQVAASVCILCSHTDTLLGFQLCRSLAPVHDLDAASCTPQHQQILIYRSRRLALQRFCSSQV